MNSGKITQIIGAVVDIAFGDSKVPALYNALEVSSEFVASKKLVLEVAAQLGRGKVRALALGPTDGLKRGDIVT
ncbi:F0F1 ATP synthase subunit beta, partial [Candidatus Gottesmanbacteria bacterium]|nr:F0F1 ATP synthase subunit beta [Candidatus Gottesmanbacteria bacterium]